MNILLGVIDLILQTDHICHSAVKNASQFNDAAQLHFCLLYTFSVAE